MGVNRRGRAQGLLKAQPRRGAQRRAIEAETDGQSNQGERHDARPGQEAYAWDDAGAVHGLNCLCGDPADRTMAARPSIAVLCQVAGAK